MTWTPRKGNPRYKTPAHRKARATLLKAYRPGDPCCLCGHPMWPAADGSLAHLHADHLPGTDTYRGLAHGHTPCPTCNVRCNVEDGARRARQARAPVTRDPRSRDW